MLSNTACADCSYAIQDHSFTSDFRLLEVQGYDIILGTDWLYTHSPVGLDLKTRTFSITKDGQELVTLVDESQPSKHVTISAKKMCHWIRKQEIVIVLVLSNGSEREVAALPPQQQHPAIASLLQEYEAIFQEPHQLPPPRSVDLAITLVEGSKLVNQRPYRLPFHQKMPWKN
jgi:hypothetical protein